MNINVTTTKVNIDDESLNKGEYNVRECNFTFSEEYEGLVCKALFTVTKTKLTYEQSIVNGKCNIPYEATINRGKVIVGVIGYEVEDEELVKRYSPEPDEFFVLDGSYIEDIENQSTPTPSELEQLEQRVSAIELDAGQVEINAQNISDLQENKADKTELDDFITKDANDLTYYTLTTQTGSQIELSLNSTNFKMTATLKDKNGNVVNTSNEIDLPLESVVVNASYDSTTKELVLTLQNGTTVRVSIADLISGLQTEITSSNKLNADLVDDSTSTNKFVTASDKTNWNAKVSDTDYATTSKAGVIKTNNALGTQIYSADGILRGTTRTFAQYQSDGITMFISKGTLENVITGKQLVNETQLNTKADKSSLVSGSGTEVTLQNTAELEFIQPPYPGGNSEQVQYSEKNLFDGNEVPVKTETYNSYISTLLTSIWKANVDINDLNLPLTFSTYITANTYIGSNLRLQFFDENGTSITTLQGTTATASDKRSILTLSNDNLPSSAKYVALKVRIADGGYTENTQIESGSTATSYEPYCGGTASPNPSYPQAISNVTGDVEVLVQNKNILPTNVEDWEQGTISSGINYSSTTRIRTVDYWRIENDTNYHISIQNTNYCFLNIWLYDKNKNCIGQYFEIDNQLNGTTNLTINISSQDVSNVYYMRVLIRKTDNTSTITANEIETIKPMIELGTTATTYTPHKEQTFTFPLGNQRMYLEDYLADDGIHHVRLTNNLKDLTWRLRNTNSEGISTYQATLTGRKYASVLSSLSNYFTFLGNVTGTAQMYEKGEGFGYYYNPNYSYDEDIYLNIKISTLAELQTWLNNNNPLVEYELATEEITPYTTEQQTAYDEIKQAISYEEQTNISGSSDESNPLFEVQAVKYKEPDYWTIAYVNTQIGNAIGGAY